MGGDGMANPIIWYNPACSKCRKTREILEERGIVPVLREYLNDPPSREELEDAAERVGLRKLVRVNHAALTSSDQTLDTMTTDDILNFLLENPEAIQRPVAFLKDRACVARPPENVLTLFEES